MPNNILEEIKCPFYIGTPAGNKSKSGYARSIVCEGVADGVHQQVRFRDFSDYLRWKVKFCESLENCPKCPYFQIASFQYI